MAELVRLQIYEDINDTWAYITLGLERQPDAAVGAPGAAKSAPVVDEEEDVHEIHGELAEQHEVIGSMVRDMSKFTVWATHLIA
ncbi:hypothetical protein Tco_0051974 [Tanacetum coccineum]